MRSLLLIAACAACDTNEVVEVGIIELTGGGGAPSPVLINNPTTARVGQSFEVQIGTYGHGCIAAEGTVVEVLSADAIDITPYDRRRTTGTCTLKLCGLAHEATIVFDTAGTKTLRFTGRRARSIPVGTDDADQEYIEVWRQVVVEE